MQFNLIFDYSYDHLEEELVHCDGGIAFDPTLFRPLDSLLPCEVYMGLVLALYEIKQSQTLVELLHCAGMHLAALCDMMFIDEETIGAWIANPDSFEKAKKHIAYHIFVTRVLTFLDEKCVEELENS